MRDPQSSSTSRHVVITGAGIAGLTAATLLAEAGLRVTLCEAAAEAGGKAKSLRRPDGHPTEHSLRIYSDHYQTLLTLLSRIPNGEGQTILDNLVRIGSVRVTSEGLIGQPHPPLPLTLKTRKGPLGKAVARVRAVFGQFRKIVVRSMMLFVGLRRRRVGRSEILSYLYAHLRLLWMCEDRVRAKLCDISYGNYLGFDRISPQARAFFSAIPRILAAARPAAEAAAILPMVLKALFHFTTSPWGLENASLTTAMMMNGPTSERLIDPWLKYLRDRGVDIQFNTRIDDLVFIDGRVSSLITADGRRLDCDYAVLALPYLVLRRLAGQSEVRKHLPHLAESHCIEMESSNGMQCFLRDLPTPCPPQLTPGVVASYLESEWCLIAIVQGEGLWRNVALPQGTKYVLSVTWSDVETPGRLFRKTLPECSPDEIVAECLAQCGIDKSIVTGWQIDHELRFMEENDYRAAANALAPHLAIETKTGRRLLNFSPLSILLPGARSHGPQIHTEVPNLMLAGEAAHSPDLTLFIPTMEKAASSGYVAAMKLARHADAKAAGRIQMHFRDSFPFATLRRLDRWLWNHQRPSSREIGAVYTPFASATKAASRAR
jgi:uncharacterized protein with NAD-binding domain and iron-sulfur cluster